MYHFIIKRKVRQTFDLVNAHRYAKVVQSMTPDVEHSFAGDHALGGTRHDRAAVLRWLERLGRVIPSLRVTIRRVVVTGWPHNTLAVVQWTATATLHNGQSYTNEGAHFITLQWGKVVAIKVYEDSQAVAGAMKAQFAAGTKEAAASPILS